MCWIEFSPEVVAEILRGRYEHPQPRVQRKLEVLWFWSCGLPAAEVARLAAVSRRTAERYLKEFIAGGLQATQTLRWKGSSSELTAHTATLQEEFIARPVCTAAEACTRIERLTGVKRHVTQVRKFLKHSLGMKWRRVKAIPLPPKSTLEEHVQKQAEFLQDELEPVIEDARENRRSLFFVDAAHFVQGSFLGSLWSVVVLFVRAASGRKRYNVLGAINPFSKSFVSVRNTGYVTATTVCELLNKLAALNTGLPITLVLDNARYQKCALVTSKDSDDEGGEVEINHTFCDAYFFCDPPNLIQPRPTIGQRPSISKIKCNGRRANIALSNKLNPAAKTHPIMQSWRP